MSRAARPCNRFCSLLLGLALLMPASLPLSAAETVAPPSPRTLIIDTDPGADDVIALLFAMASPKELKIQALTTVAGNVPLEKTARNARLAREWGKRPDIPVSRRRSATAAAHADLRRRRARQRRHQRRRGA